MWPRWRWTRGRSWPSNPLLWSPTTRWDTLHERIKVVERDLYIRTIEEIIDRGYVL